MAFSVLRMGKKLGLVGAPKIRLGAASTPGVLRQANCHMSTNMPGPGENAQGLSTEENAREIAKGKSAVRLFGSIILLWAIAGHWAYQDYCKGKILDQKYEDQEKLIKEIREARNKNKGPELSRLVELSKD